MKLTIAALLLLATVVGAIGFGRASSRGKTVADWAVGGRSMGTLLFWFMNAGEIYTTFAVFGIAGYAWALGAPAYLAFCSVSLSFVIGYLLMPKIWRAGRRAGLVTQADFFAYRYDARWLGVVTGLIGIASLVIYVQIQLVSLSLVVSLTFDQALSPTWSLMLAGALMVAFVFFSGLRSAAFAAAVKDVLMIVLMVVLAATVASKVGAKSMFDIFDMAEAMRPGIGKLPGADATAPTTNIWLITAALNVALGNWVFPHLFQISYSADSPTSIRRNAIWQPVYSMAYFFIILLGLAALVAGTQPPGNNMNAALLQFVSTQYPDWVIGLLAGTGVLLALVPGSVLLLTASSIFTRNVVTPMYPALSDARGLLVSRVALVVLGAVAVWLSMGEKGSLVSILLKAYSAIGMLGPGVFLAFLWKRTTALGVVAGIVVGFVALLAPFAQTFWSTWFAGWEVGLLAMAVNAVTVLLVSLVTPRPAPAAIALGLSLQAHPLTRP
jgi:SSS family solute:Na+ symporter